MAKLDEELKQSVREWLREQTWFPKYIINIANDVERAKGEGVSIDVLDKLDGSLLGCSIAAAFRWSQTPEGHTYWARANEDLENFVKEWERKIKNKEYE